MHKTILSLLFLTVLAAVVGEARAAIEPTLRLRLWDGPAPGAPENPEPEVNEEGGRVSRVSIPTLDVYLPAPDKANGQAIIIFGGGAYKRLTSGPRGAGAAERFLPKGIAVFSLKYRLRPPSTDIIRDALADAERAVRLVRSRAVEWRIDPARIGVVGFSAGSNLALHLVVNADAGNPASKDVIERFSSRPDFIGLCCPWPFDQKIGQFKIDERVPPAFLVHCRDDKTAPFSFSEDIVAAWKRAGVPAELHPYDVGGHQAFSLPNETIKDWPDKLLAWLDAQPELAAKARRR